MGWSRYTYTYRYERPSMVGDKLTNDTTAVRMERSEFQRFKVYIYSTGRNGKSFIHGCFSPINISTSQIGIPLVGRFKAVLQTKVRYCKDNILKMILSLEIFIQGLYCCTGFFCVPRRRATWSSRHESPTPRGLLSIPLLWIILDISSLHTPTFGLEIDCLEKNFRWAEIALDFL